MTDNECLDPERGCPIVRIRDSGAGPTSTGGADAVVVVARVNEVYLHKGTPYNDTLTVTYVFCRGDKGTPYNDMSNRDRDDDGRNSSKRSSILEHEYAT